jgi:E3 ubiquitin-protein ligase RNF13
MAGGAVGAVILVFLLYKDFVRCAVRRRAAIARRNIVKTIRSMALKELRSGLPPGNEAEECAVCLEDYEEEVEVAKLDCRHHYHDRCVRCWVAEGQPTCPLCEMAVVWAYVDSIYHVLMCMWCVYTVHF